MGTYLVILAVAGIVNFIAFIWLVIVGFQRSVLWGILVFLFSPLAALVFAIMHWLDAKKPFLLYIVSTIAMIVPIVMMLMQADTRQLAQIMQGVESGEIRPNEAFEQYGKQEPGTDAQTDPGMTPPDGTPQATESEIMAMADKQEQGETATDITNTPATSAKADTATQSADTNVSVDKKAEETSPYPSPGVIKPDPLMAKKKPTESPTIRINLEKIAAYKGRYFIITTTDGREQRGLLNKVTNTTLYLSRKLYGGDFEYHIAKKKVKYVDMLKEEYVKDFMDK